MKILAFIFYISCLAASEWISPDIENYDCHSSSIVEAAPGQLCVDWKAGHGTGKSNIDITQGVGVWASLFNLRMLCRDRAQRIQETGYIWMATSKDGGLTWSDFESTHLPNPDSGIEVVDLGAGKLLLIYNHSHTDRHPLNWSLSLDGGETWSPPELLDSTGEFPSAIQSADGSIHITYARARGKQRGIMHLNIHASYFR